MRNKSLFLILMLLLCTVPGYAEKRFPSIGMFEMRHDGITEDGFRYGIQKVYPDARFYIYNLGGQEQLLDAYLVAAKEREHDLYYVAGTKLTRLVLEREHAQPVVFTLVPAPVEERMIASWGSSENNATGVSNRVPILNQLKTLKRIVSFKVLGVLCQEDHQDSLQQVHELERLQSFLGYRVKRNCLNPTSAQLTISPEYIEGLDAVYITNTPLFDAYGKQLVAQLNQFHIPSMSADMNMVRNSGALLGLVPDNYRIGRLAALNAQHLLEGDLPSNVPSKDLDYFMVILNMNTAREIGAQVPLSLLIIADTIVR